MTHIIRVAGSDIEFASEDGETILDAAERAGFALPYSCRKGVCATCEGGLRAGRVALGRSEVASGPAEGVKFCLARSETDCEIAPSSIEHSEPPARKTFNASVHAIERPTADVAILHLRLPIGRRAPFRAGQYVRLMLEGGETRNFSLANPPHDNASVELHVRRVPGGRFSDRAMAELSFGDTVRLELPYGRAVLDDSDAPIVMLATGTGFAPLKSMVEDLAYRRLARPVHLYWGAAAEGDLYQAALARRWAATHPWFQFTPVLSHPAAGWSGATGFVQDMALADHPDLSSHQVFACGNPGMVESARQLFLRRGSLQEGAFHADAFLPSGTPSPGVLEAVG